MAFSGHGRDHLRETYEAFLENGDEWKTPLELAKQVMGQNGTKKQINPFLYELQKMGLVRKRTVDDRGVAPIWSLRWN
jgi:hypothetical protein